MNARFDRPSFFPAAITDALDRIESATFAHSLAPSAMREEIRAALRQARDAMRDAQSAMDAQSERLNTALGLR